MKAFLGVCLLLGVVSSVLIPSAFGLKCVECDSVGSPKDCKHYTKGDSKFHDTCNPLGQFNSSSGLVKPVCRIDVKVINGQEEVARNCMAGIPLCAPANPLSPDWKVCSCDTELCNESIASAEASVNKATGKPGSDQSQGHGLALKGPSFGILVMVLLGGVGLIRGQLWG